MKCMGRHYIIGSLVRLCVVCGIFFTLCDSGYADWRDVPEVKGVCSRGCEPPTSPRQINGDIPSEQPLREPVYGPSPEELQEAQARAERAKSVERELKNNIVRLNAPANTLLETPNPVTIRPGTSFFGILSGVETFLTAPLAGVKTPGSRIPMENLLRAVAILESIKSDGLDEDAGFLANQAALAMDGEPLQVQVDISDVTNTENVRQAQQLAKLTDEIHKDKESALIKERWIIESDLAEIRQKKEKETDPGMKWQLEVEEAGKSKAISSITSQLDYIKLKKDDIAKSIKNKKDFGVLFNEVETKKPEGAAK